MIDDIRYIKARVIAGQIRPLDEIQLGGTWWTVTAVAEFDGRVELKTDGGRTPLEYRRNTPLMARWRAPSTTTGLRAQHHR